MNVNAAGMSDIPITSSTAPVRDSKNRDTEASGTGFQQVIEQFADRKDNRSEKPKEDEYIDPRTLTAHLKSEDDKKADEGRRRAMMAQAETVAVQVVTPEMLMEAVGENGQAGIVTAIDPSLNNQSSDSANSMSDQGMMTAAGLPNQGSAMIGNSVTEENQSTAVSSMDRQAEAMMQGTDAELLTEQLTAPKDSVKTLNYENGNSQFITGLQNQQMADQTVTNRTMQSTEESVLPGNSPITGQGTNQTAESVFDSTKSQIDGSALQKSGSNSSRQEMIFETTDDYQKIMSQGDDSIVMAGESQSSESLQKAEQSLSESAVGQTTVVSDVVSASGQMETSSTARNSQPAVQSLSSDFAGQSVAQDQAASKAAGQSSAAGDQESGFADMLKHQSLSTKTMNSASDSEAVSDKSQSSTVDEVQASLEELKKNAEAKGVNLMDRMTEARMMSGAKVQTLNQTPGHNGANVVSQLKDGLEMGMKNQLREFTIHLKPEGLGEVIINMVSQDGKLTVNIGASNADTQKLINSQMMSLKEMLEPLHAEVGQVYQSSQESTGFLSYGQNMSENQRQQTSRFQGQPGYGTYPMDDEEILTEAEYISAQSRMARLYTYV